MSTNNQKKEQQTQTFGALNISGQALKTETMSWRHPTTSAGRIYYAVAKRIPNYDTPGINFHRGIYSFIPTRLITRLFRRSWRRFEKRGNRALVSLCLTQVYAQPASLPLLSYSDGFLLHSRFTFSMRS